MTPVVHAARRCSIHLHDEVKAELDSMEQLGVISKVTVPTDWVSSLVYRQKSNNKLRICLDPKDLNTAIKRPHYKTPTMDEIVVAYCRLATRIRRRMRMEVSRSIYYETPEFELINSYRSINTMCPYTTLPIITTGHT